MYERDLVLFCREIMKSFACHERIRRFGANGEE